MPALNLMQWCKELWSWLTQFVLKKIKILFAIIMMTAEEDVKMLQNTLSVLYSPNHYYLVHADFGEAAPEGSLGC
jgi:hypothetical protein